MVIAKGTGRGEQRDVSLDKRRMRHRTATVQKLEIFYREAGPADATTLVLLHGFPSASHQYARLLERLSDRFHVVAPDYPGLRLQQRACIQQRRR